ncbi:TrmH family RNA methyltransferase [Leptospira licerasiae]|uniref:tRNA (guanosine(18)-2'-O)-methyltransferase n=1 Tax=Leptospira licerasiae str. MMD4847 TaxID=1049971 RepID=A0ABN0H8N9_9LEPT|nr:RNA methyltransferase [Leptospira licerasiae]EID99777.1 RNA methyltransferase, TrmH family [Leptospira licerasiae serovar Varillal str. VAR 010]EJZ41937.1 RNA methyltransferase, TrmH family [Leptospira licerasiae str. MMD4847]
MKLSQEHSNFITLEEAIRLEQYFKTLISPEKVSKIQEVASFRTKYLTIVMEDIFQPYNASAPVRTSECLGLTEIHVVENRNPYRPNEGISLGAQKWIQIHKYQKPNIDNTRHCISGLKEKGYRVVATSPHTLANSYELNTLPLDKPCAILFGSEEKGLSSYSMEEADVFLKLPMYGFTESYNISVTVAIVLSHLAFRLRKEVPNWGLTEEEKLYIRNSYYKKCLHNGNLVESDLLQRIRSEPTRVQ